MEAAQAASESNTVPDEKASPATPAEAAPTIVAEMSEKEDAPPSNIPIEKEHPMQPERLSTKATDNQQRPNMESLEPGHAKEESTGAGKPSLEEETAAELESRAIPNSVKDENGFVYYKCRFCGLTFNYMSTLKAHERVHDIDQPYLCNKCGESFHFMCELEYHAKQHSTQKGYKCECGRTFYQYTDLLYHRHPGEEGDAMPVSLPPPQLEAWQSQQQKAINMAEFPTPEFKTEGFEPKYQVRTYSDVRSRPYICQYCSKSYPDSRGLAYHMYSHRGERLFNPRASRYLMCRNDNSYLSPGVPL